MTQNTEQNVRTRSEEIAEYATGMSENFLSDALCLHPSQPYSSLEAVSIYRSGYDLGAEEQRRKDAEGQEAVAWLIQDKSKGKPGRAYSPDRAVTDKAHADKAARFNSNVSALYTCPANVAALEALIAELTEAEQLARADAEASKARVTVLEGENNTLKTRVINAAENLLSIETPCMKGDNFAVTICSYFEDCEGETCDSGWHEGATKAYEEIKDAVLQHFRAALAREGGTP